MILAIWRKEVSVTWTTPIPYIVGGLFQAMLGLLFVDQLQARMQAVVQPLFPLAGFLLIITVPILTMRSIAEEARTGTLDLLLAIPIGAVPLVVGKWLAATTTVFAVVAPAVVYAWLVGLYGDPDAGPVISGFVGLALLASALTALGMLTSAATSSTPVAAMVSFVVAAALWFAGTAGNAIRAGGLLDHVSLSERVRSFANGAVDTGDAGFFVALILAALALAVVAVDARRLR